MERIGEFLVRIGAMTQEQADEVLAKQRQEPGRLFGEIALEMEYINNTAIDKYLSSRDN